MTKHKDGTKKQAVEETQEVVPQEREQEEEELYAIVPPNGGWGWLVVLCAFYCNIVADGIQLTFGIFLKTISEDLNADYSKVAFAGSLMFGTHLLMGPVTCGFNSIFGLRPVTITGSLICCFGIGISYFSPNYWCLCLSFGLIGGVGLGLVYMNTLVITSLYFTTLLPAAVAVVVSGTGVGTMVLAGCGSIILSATTWQIAFLMQSALAGSMALAAMAFKPLRPIRVKLSRDSQTSVKAGAQEKGIQKKNTGLFIKTELPRSDSYKSLVTVQTAARGFVESVISSEFLNAVRSNWVSRYCKCCKKKNKETEVIVLSELRSEMTDRTQRKSYVEKVHVTEKEMEKKESSHLAISRIHSSMSYNTVFTRIDIPRSKKTKAWDKLKKPVITMLDFRLLKNFSFSLFVLIGATELASFLIVLVYEKDRSVDLGFSEDMGVYFIIAIGAGNVFWRLFLGGIALIPGVNYAALSAISIIIGGLATTFSGFNRHVLYQFAFCFIFGLGMGSFAVFRMPFLVQLVDPEKIENATGICLLFMGVLCIIFPPVFGAILVHTKNFNILFITAGVIIILSGVAQFAVRRRKVRKI